MFLAVTFATADNDRFVTTFEVLLLISPLALELAIVVRLPTLREFAETTPEPSSKETNAAISIDNSKNLFMCFIISLAFIYTFFIRTTCLL